MTTPSMNTPDGGVEVENLREVGQANDAPEQPTDGLHSAGLDQPGNQDQVDKLKRMNRAVNRTGRRRNQTKRNARGAWTPEDTGGNFLSRPVLTSRVQAVTGSRPGCESHPLVGTVHRSDDGPLLAPSSKCAERSRLHIYQDVETVCSASGFGRSVRRGRWSKER